MRIRDTMTALALALACHAALLFVAAASFEEAQILLESGVCGVDMWLVPSPESAGDADQGVVRPDPAPILSESVGAEDVSPPPLPVKPLPEAKSEDASAEKATPVSADAVDAAPESPPEQKCFAEENPSQNNVVEETTVENEQKTGEQPAVESHAADGSPLPKGTDAKAVGLTMPKYPYASRVNSEEGRVVISVTIHADGSAYDIKITESSGSRLLDEAALGAVRRASFVPATKGGIPVESTLKLAFVFTLKDE